MSGFAAPRCLEAALGGRHPGPSRTPEGRYGQCPGCGTFVCVNFSEPSGDAPCPSCGRLLWLRELHWPFVCDDPSTPLHDSIARRPRTNTQRLGRVVEPLARRLRTVPASPGPPRPSRRGLRSRRCTPPGSTGDDGSSTGRMILPDLREGEARGRIDLEAGNRRGPRPPGCSNQPGPWIRSRPAASRARFESRSSSAPPRWRRRCDRPHWGKTPGGCGAEFDHRSSGSTPEQARFDSASFTPGSARPMDGRRPRGSRTEGGGRCGGTSGQSCRGRARGGGRCRASRPRWPALARAVVRRPAALVGRRQRSRGPGAAPRPGRAGRRGRPGRPPGQAGGLDQRGLELEQSVAGALGQ